MIPCIGYSEDCEHCVAAFLGNYTTEVPPRVNSELLDVEEDDFDENEEVCDNCGEHLEDCECEIDEDEPEHIPSEDEFGRSAGEYRQSIWG